MAVNLISADWEHGGISHMSDHRAHTWLRYDFLYKHRLDNNNYSMISERLIKTFKILSDSMNG